MGLGTHARAGVALCSDVLSEGVNLQGASCVVHLDTPTVIRTAEQRAGRVDRMDSAHDTVEIWWPRNPPAFAPRKRDLLRERHEVVADLIGANLSLPDDDDAPLDIEDLAATTSAEHADDPAELYDAFRPVRQLIGPGGLITSRVYARIRTSQADVVACVSAVQSRSEWAFMAVGGRDRIAPSWVCFEHPDADPVTDFAKVAAALRARLGDGVVDVPIDRRAEAVMERFLARLRTTERRLLPVRRQRALALAEKVVSAWRDGAWGQPERSELLRTVLDAIGPSPDQDHPDPRDVADIFLRLVDAQKRSALAERRSRRRPWRLDDLAPRLIREPIPDEALRRAFSRVRMIPAVDRRVVAMIMGIAV